MADRTISLGQTSGAPPSRASTTPQNGIQRAETPAQDQPTSTSDVPGLPTSLGLEQLHQGGQDALQPQSASSYSVLGAAMDGVQHEVSPTLAEGQGVAADTLTPQPAQSQGVNSSTTAAVQPQTQDSSAPTTMLQQAQNRGGSASPTTAQRAQDQGGSNAMTGLQALGPGLGRVTKHKTEDVAFEFVLRMNQTVMAVFTKAKAGKHYTTLPKLQIGALPEIAEFLSKKDPACRSLTAVTLHLEQARTWQVVALDGGEIHGHLYSDWFKANIKNGSKGTVKIVVDFTAQ